MSKCELCQDGKDAMLFLHAICHPTAPLRAQLDGTTLTLYCYVPTCNRLVATFEVQS